MRDRFSEALRHLGHVYSRAVTEPRPARVRHIVQVFVPTGEILPICGASPIEAQQLGCRELWLDTNCPKCRELRQVPAAVLTKRSLMLDLINTLCDIEQTWLDAMNWNYHNPDKEPINPDPDGALAKGWLEGHEQLIRMLACFEPTMKRHEGRFNWPTDLETPDDRV